MGEANENRTGQTNAKLSKARAARNDEFYTRRESIEEELQHYFPHFRGKTVYCNCDDPSISEFTRYFRRQFSFFGLRRLIATCYKNQNVDIFSPHKCSKAAYLEYNGKPRKYTLKDDGDFRSEECIRLLRQTDVVCTNPPFSLFREYVAQLVAAEKQFLIIGNFNAVSYREIFRLIMGGKLWLGAGHRTMEFDTPDGSVVRLRNVIWFTNLEHDKRREEFPLTMWYKDNESAYPKYDNYDAINVNRGIDIPRDYAGVMGVPISFLDKWNPDQFEIVGQMASTTVDECNYGYPYIGGKRQYARVLIRNRRPE